MEDVIAGRPVFSFPSRAAGFRLRYGRARNTGLSAMGVHPVTMLVLQRFMAAGTQLRIEAPGKAGVVLPVDALETPIVRLKDGSVVRVSSENFDSVRDQSERVLFLGDILISYGDFLYNNKPLYPAGITEEWWIQDLRTAIKQNFNGIQWDRQIIRTVGSNYTWIGASGPVTYEFDMAKHVDKAYAGFNFFMHLVPGIPDPGRGDSDWHETNVVMWTVGVLNDGAAWSELRFKTNAFDDNGVLYSTGNLGGVWNATPVGTWKLTLENNTNVTITAPGGGTLITNIPQEVIDVFTAASSYMQINLGIVPGDLSRAGQMAVLTRAKIC